MDKDFNYRKPWILQRADPYVIECNGVYYFTASVPEYDRIVLRQSNTLVGLKDAEERTLWVKHDHGPMSKHIWAPEMHYVFGGWYISGGPDISDAVEKFHDEMKRWEAKGFNGPIVFTEFGTDTLATEHKLPSVMWSQEYQCEYLEENFKVFDTYDFIQGELVWNFADFQTGQGIMRVNGNKKGLFTRQRQPKDAAFTMKKRWEQKA